MFKFSVLKIFWLTLACCPCCGFCNFLLAPSTSSPTLFLQFTHLSAMPPQILNFKGEGWDAGFVSQGYYQYQADESYFQFLQTHTSFINASSENHAFRPALCKSQLPADYSDWTTDSVTTTNKQCFVGVYYPYVHYLIYDESTQETLHFIEGMHFIDILTK